MNQRVPKRSQGLREPLISAGAGGEMSVDTGSPFVGVSLERGLRGAPRLQDGKEDPQASKSSLGSYQQKTVSTAPSQTAPSQQPLPNSPFPKQLPRPSIKPGRKGNAFESQLVICLVQSTSKRSAPLALGVLAGQPSSLLWRVEMVFPPLLQ